MTAFSILTNTQQVKYFYVCSFIHSAGICFCATCYV
uniref:Uncharacterized protein n=1 Tax=Anguilla anguilla TaxID=7936 RepID=A0A0E9UKG3_ANGAN